MTKAETITKCGADPLYGAGSWALCGVYRLPITSDSWAVSESSLVIVLMLLISGMRWI